MERRVGRLCAQGVDRAHESIVARTHEEDREEICRITGAGRARGQDKLVRHHRSVTHEPASPLSGLRRSAQPPAERAAPLAKEIPPQSATQIRGAAPTRSAGSSDAARSENLSRADVARRVNGIAVIEHRAEAFAVSPSPRGLRFHIGRRIIRSLTGEETASRPLSSDLSSGRGCRLTHSGFGTPATGRAPETAIFGREDLKTCTVIGRRSGLKQLKCSPLKSHRCSKDGAHKRGWSCRRLQGRPRYPDRRR